MEVSACLADRRGAKSGWDADKPVVRGSYVVFGIASIDRFTSEESLANSERWAM